MNNVAGVARYAGMQKALRAELGRYLTETNDPRAAGRGEEFDRYFYVTAATANSPATATLPATSNFIPLHASNAVVHGTTLRYEPQTNKNCLGFWTRVEDWAEWSFTAPQSGEFEVEVWQGCGKGQGGSEVLVEVGGESFRFTVEDTGNFQNFRARRLGRVKLAANQKYSLAIKPQRKQASAVMDIREVKLIPFTP
jgi:hypothetical protein